MGMSMTVIIKDDYTYQVSITSPDGPQTDSGTWSESGNSLTINSTVDNMQQIVNFTVTNETLVFEMTNFDFMEEGVPATLEFAKQQPSGTIPLSQVESALVGNYELTSLTVSTTDSSYTLSGENLDMSVTLTVSNNRVFTAVSNEQGQTTTDIGSWSASSNIIFVLWNTGEIEFIPYNLSGSSLTVTFYQNETIDDNFERLTFSKQ
jgi:hypothetical protein